MRKTAKAGIRSVVFDWAGTLIDHGHLAPLTALNAAFESFALHIAPAQLRWAMHGRKRDQIETLLRVPSVLRAFERAHGRGPDARDVEALHAAYAAAELAAIRQRAELVAGAIDAVVDLHARGVAVAAISDYPRAGDGLLLELASRQHLALDYSAAIDDAAVGGSGPALILECMNALRVEHPRCVLFVGASRNGIEAAGHVGCARIAVASTGSEVGLDWNEWRTLPPSAQNSLLAHAHRNLRDAGADFVIDSLHDLPLAVERIAERRLSPAA